jgi:hypothetical protein
MKANTQLLTVGLTVVTLLSGDLALRFAQAKAGGATKVVSAEEFHLVDSEGKVRARLGVLKDRPGLALYDKDGKTPRAILGLTAEGKGALMMMDAEGKIVWSVPQ